MKTHLSAKRGPLSTKDVILSAKHEGSLKILEKLLRRAGGGVYLVSSGKSEQLEFQKYFYSAPNEKEILSKWRKDLSGISTAKIAFLGVPSDVGAGYMRGANLGPQAIRDYLTRKADIYRNPRIVDIGDIFVVPQYLSDEMLSHEQIRRGKKGIYGTTAVKLPVGPLDMVEKVLLIIKKMNPQIVPIILGGDHSVSWPAVKALLSFEKKNALGILHIDAHTDLLNERLGVRYCFGTWAYHANDLVGRGGRLVQVGIRSSAKSKQHWERTLKVKQYWAEEVNCGGDRIVKEIVRHFRKKNISRIYISNDIDGTDPAWAAATGTMEQDGLRPEFVEKLISEVGANFDVIGCDVVEVAPPLRNNIPGEPEKTLKTAARYIQAYLAGY